jgi:uncharacterized protein
VTEDVVAPPAALSRPGWYADPFARFAHRWWDGSRWTEYARDAEVQWDPEPLGDDAPARQRLPGLGAAAIGAGASVVLSIVTIAWLSAVGEPGGRLTTVVLSQLALWSGLVTACVVVSRRHGTGSLVRDYALRFHWIDLGFGLAGAIAGRLTAIVAATLIPFAPTRSLPDAERTVFGDEPSSAAAWIALFVITCVGAPLIEELFFRGLVQTRLVSRLGVVAGIGVASLLFGAAHLLSWNGAESLVNAWAIAVAGLTLGTLRYLTGRLGASIVAHAFFNIQALVVLALLS